MTSLQVTFLAHFCIIYDFSSTKKYANVILEILVLKLLCTQFLCEKISVDYNDLTHIQLFIMCVDNICWV